MIGRRGQGAMEYLMTYGWAILVVMIVGIVMWQLGIFSMGTTTVTATGFSKIKPQLAGTGVSGSTGKFTGVFMNGAGSAVSVKSVTLEGKTGNLDCSAAIVALPSAPVAAGDNFELSTTAPTHCTETGNAGDVYQLLVTINYNISIGGLTTDHSDSGIIRGPLE